MFTLTIYLFISRLRKEKVYTCLTSLHFYIAFAACKANVVDYMLAAVEN